MNSLKNIRRITRYSMYGISLCLGFLFGANVTISYVFLLLFILALVLSFDVRLESLENKGV